MTFYCENCSILFIGDRCPACRRKSTRSAEPDDICFLTEKEQIWAGMLAEVLTQNNIPFIQKNVMGAGMALRVGPMFERVRFYVYYRHLDKAKEIVEELFSSTGAENDADAEE